MNRGRGGSALFGQYRMLPKISRISPDQQGGQGGSAFPDKATHDIDFIDEAVGQCYVPVVKILL